MEIQFEQNKEFNQSHREDRTVTDTNTDGSRQPQGEEGSPKQKLINREELDREEKELDRRPSDIANGNANTMRNDNSSAIAGIQNDQQNSTEGMKKPLGEDPNHNAEIENKEDEDGDE